MPTTRQQRKPAKKTLQIVKPPKLKSTIKRTLSDSNLNTSTASCTEHTHTASQPLPDIDTSRPSTPIHTHNTSIQIDTDSPPEATSPIQELTSNKPINKPPVRINLLEKYPNSYGITLNSQPAPPEPIVPNNPTQPTATDPPTTNHAPTENSTPTETDQTTEEDVLILGTQQSPVSKIQDKQATPTDNSTKTQDPTSLKNELFLLKTKQTKAQHHLTFLQSALDSNTVPKGFHIQLSPQVMDAQDTDINEVWHDALIDTSKKLIEITHDHYKILLATLTEKIDELEALLHKLQIDPNITQQQDTRLKTLHNKLEETRRRKLDNLMKPPTEPHTQVSHTNTNKTREPFLSEPQRKHQQNTKEPPRPYRRTRKALLPTPPYPPPFLNTPQPIPAYRPYPPFQTPHRHTLPPHPPPLMSLPPVPLPAHLQPYQRPLPLPPFP